VNYVLLVAIGEKLIIKESLIFDVECATKIRTKCGSHVDIIKKSIDKNVLKI